MTPSFAHVFTAAFIDWECQQGLKRAQLSLVKVMCELRKGVGPSDSLPHTPACHICSPTQG